MISQATRAVLLWLLVQAHSIVRRLPCSTAPQPRLRWRIGTPGQTPLIDCESYRMRLTTVQFAVVSLLLLDALGRPANADGAPTWASSDPTVATVTPDPSDPLRATVTAVGPGVAQISVSVDADLSEGVRTLTATGAIEVVPAEAQTLELQFGPAQLQSAGGAAIEMKKTDLI